MEEFKAVEPPVMPPPPSAGGQASYDVVGEDYDSDWDENEDDWGNQQFQAPAQRQSQVVTSPQDYTNAILPQTPDDTGEFLFSFSLSFLSPDSPQFSLFIYSILFSPTISIFLPLIFLILCLSFSHSSSISSSLYQSLSQSISLFLFYSQFLSFS